MKLIFEKKDDNVTVKLATGTVPENFSYTKMIAALLDNQKIDEVVFKNLNADEKGQINQLIDRIKEAVSEEEEEEDDEEDNDDEEDD